MQSLCSLCMWSIGFSTTQFSHYSTLLTVFLFHQREYLVTVLVPALSRFQASRASIKMWHQTPSHRLVVSECHHWSTMSDKNQLPATELWWFIPPRRRFTHIMAKLHCGPSMRCTLCVVVKKEDKTTSRQFHTAVLWRPIHIEEELWTTQL